MQNQRTVDFGFCSRPQRTCSLHEGTGKELSFLERDQFLNFVLENWGYVSEWVLRFLRTVVIQP
jgi:hypothetical protein